MNDINHGYFLVDVNQGFFGSHRMKLFFSRHWLLFFADIDQGFFLPRWVNSIFQLTLAKVFFGRHQLGFLADVSQFFFFYICRDYLQPMSASVFGQRQLIFFWLTSFRIFQPKNLSRCQLRIALVDVDKNIPSLRCVKEASFG